MDDLEQRLLLEKIIFKMFRNISLDEDEKKLVEMIVEVRDYGRVLE